MNLTKEYPRSPYEKVGGYVMLGRTIDKARAKLENALGEYLRAKVFDPLLQALGGRTRLFLAPDGELSTLPFEVLPTQIRSAKPTAVLMQGKLISGTLP